MSSSKSEFSIDEQEKRSCSDADSPSGSYAIIETDPEELDQIVDLLRQFFPRTKITEYNHPNHSPTITPAQQTSPVERKKTHTHNSSHDKTSPAQWIFIFRHSKVN